MEFLPFAFNRSRHFKSVARNLIKGPGILFIASAFSVIKTPAIKYKQQVAEVFQLMVVLGGVGERKSLRKILLIFFFYVNS